MRCRVASVRCRPSILTRRDGRKKNSVTTGAGHQKPLSSRPYRVLLDFFTGYFYRYSAVCEWGPVSDRVLFFIYLSLLRKNKTKLGIYRCRPVKPLSMRPYRVLLRFFFLNRVLRGAGPGLFFPLFFYFEFTAWNWSLMGFVRLYLLMKRPRLLMGFSLFRCRC